MGNEQGYEIV